MRISLSTLIIIVLFMFTQIPSAHAQVSSTKDLQALIDDLLMRVDTLQNQLQLIKEDSKIYVVEEKNVYEQLKLYTQYPPQKITRTLRFGHTGADVERLQIYLARDPLLYPERLRTGYYGALTQKAVQRFQSKYGIVNSGTSNTTGYGQVGLKTREKVNELIARYRLNLELEARNNEKINVTTSPFDNKIVSDTQEKKILNENEIKPTTTPPTIETQNSSSSRGTYNNLVDIIFDIKPDMFLESLYHQSTDYEVEEIKEDEIVNSFWIFSKALDKYPAQVLDAHLKEIYVLRSLIRSGLDIGGTVAPDLKRLYIVNKGFSDIHVEEIFHHEFSHMLHSPNLKSVLESDWIQFNPDGFEYGSGGIDANERGVSSTSYDEKYIRDGFLSEYSVSAFPEDFSVLVQNMFMKKPIFWNIVDNNEKIHGKVNLVVKIYSSLDPIFTEQYFREISAR